MRFTLTFCSILASFSICLLGPWSALAQSDETMQYNKASAANGNTSFLNAAASVSPSLYTGGLQLSLPIYTLKSIDLQVPIAIGYTASSGVHPTDPNTCVGMDWELITGGSISRNVRGLPDEDTYGYIGPNNIGQNVVNDFNNPSASGTMALNNLYNNALGQPIVDGEPDMFTVTTPTFSLQFTLDPTNNGQAVFIGGTTGYQVIHSLYHNTSGEVNGITVIDPQGNQYVFGTQNATREWTTTKFFGTSEEFISTWYLEKIISFNSKDVVTFTYQQEPDETVYSYMNSKMFSSNWSTSTAFNSFSPPTSYSNITSLYVQIDSFHYNGPKLVSTIVTKTGEADFTYGSNYSSYLNLTTPPPLSSIVIKQFNPITSSNSNVLQTYNFNFSDILTGIWGWPGGTITDPTEWWADYRRLLTSITITGNTTATSTPLTLFNLKYYQGQNLSDKNVPQYWDYWGYQNNTSQFFTDYDNSDQNYFLYPDSYRQPASYTPTGGSQPIPMAANYAIQELDALGGSATIFNYQQNDYYNGSANVAAGGARIGSIVRQLPTGETLTTSYNYYDGSGHSTGQLSGGLYRVVYMYTNGPCCSLTTTAYSQSMYPIADDNGVWLGYSAVTTTDPNGGYTVSKFSNFSDYPDVNPVPSFWELWNISSKYTGSYSYQSQVSEQLSDYSYRRGLLLTKTAYKASGDTVSQDINTYGPPPGSPTVAAAAIGIQDDTWYQSPSSSTNGGPIYFGINVYNSNFENWRLLTTLHKDYDQLSTSRTLQTLTTYSYATDNRQIRSVSSSDSKGQNHTMTYYYADDTNIPFATTTEQQTLAAMTATSVNAPSLLIHKIDSRNGSQHQSHYTYTPSTIGAVTNYYMTTSTNYTGSSSVIQQFYNYDASTSQPLSTNLTAGKSTSTTYGYNASYPLVKIDNAGNTVTYTNQPTTVTAYLNIQPPPYGGTTSVPFTTTSAGTITVSLPAGSYLGSNGSNGVTCYFNFILTNAGSGTLCQSSVSGYSCPANSTTYTYSNMPAGNYTLQVTPSTNTSTTTVQVQYTYPGYQVVSTASTEFFFEGFEQNPLGVSGNAHTGNMYYNGSYYVPYTPPNSRQYVVQWWTLSGSQWVFNQMPYTANMTLPGPVDDVRVFPVDALMTTYTYSPLLGKTSETDPSGKTKKYVYDGLGRLQQIIDQDGNILKQYDYEYQVGLSQ